MFLQIVLLNVLNVMEEFKRVKNERISRQTLLALNCPSDRDEHILD